MMKRGTYIDSRNIEHTEHIEHSIMLWAEMYEEGKWTAWFDTATKLVRWRTAQTAAHQALLAAATLAGTTLSTREQPNADEYIIYHGPYAGQRLDVRPGGMLANLYKVTPGKVSSAKEIICDFLTERYENETIGDRHEEEVHQDGVLLVRAPQPAA